MTVSYIKMPKLLIKIEIFLVIKKYIFKKTKPYFYL
jgi:hypothetical protein